MHDCINVNGTIQFNDKNSLITTWGDGTYKIINNNTIKASWCDDVHILKFSDDKTRFISIRRGDNNVSTGIL
jgi:hypothetical protein